MKTTTIHILVLGLLGSLSMGCGGAAWQVRRGDWSGELALHGPITDAHHAAEDTMLAHCRGRARIVSGAEAERVAMADSSAVPSREITVDHGGRRLHYICVSRAPVAFRGRPSTTIEVSARDNGTPSGL